MKIRLLLALIGSAISFAMPLAVVLVGLVISIVSLTYAQQKDTIDPQIDQQLRVFTMK
jgi:hypothetical protein